MILGKELDHIGELNDLALRHAVIIARARDGEIVVLDDDISSKEVVLAGGGLGAVMMAVGVAQQGALALPGGWSLAALAAALLAGGLVGAGVSRAAATLIDSDYRNMQVKTLAAELKAGTRRWCLSSRKAWTRWSACARSWHPTVWSWWNTCTRRASPSPAWRSRAGQAPLADSTTATPFPAGHRLLMTQSTPSTNSTEPRLLN